jgi:spermidine/putrescine transport system permease protein
VTRVSKLFAIWTGFVFLFFYLPIAVLVLFSFNESKLNIVWTGFTLDWYTTLLDDRVLVRTLKNSLIVASATTVASVFLGTAGAWLLYRYRYRASSFLETLVFLPMIVPEVILGVSLLILFVTIGMKLGYTTIVISHVTFCFPFVMAAVQARLAGLDPSLEEAALDLGATPLQAFTKVLVPYLMPAIVSGALMTFTLSLDELIVTYFTASAGTRTLPLEIFGRVKKGLDPSLNAGTVALMYFFSRSHSLNEWLRIMDQTSGFASFYQSMFGDPWARADRMGPLFPPGLTQPEMALPFEKESPWAFTSGPHGAWEHDGPLAALDFAPAASKTGCNPTPTWILASAPGLVVRSGNGIVVVDLDGDGKEQTGWNILYLHVANQGRVAKGQWVEADDRIGHASCEGGIATGTHLHIARKYNGEWMIADGPVPFVLNGWTAVAGEKPYEGKLVKGNRVITADLYGQLRALILREDDGE